MIRHEALATCVDDNTANDFCGGRPAPGGGKRLLQASAAGACDLDTIAADADRVTADCCDGATDGCGDTGVATTCDIKCAASFIGFFDRCGTFLEAAYAARAGAYLALYDTCSRGLPLVPLLATAARCAGIATGDSYKKRTASHSQACLRLTLALVI